MKAMRQVLVLALLASQVLSAHYALDVATGFLKWHDTDGNVEAVIRGRNGHVDFHLIDNANIDDFKLGAVDHFDLPDDSMDVGVIECVEFTTRSDDLWMVDYVVVTGGPRPTYLYNTEGTILSTDPTEGVPQLELCRQGFMTYTVEVTTAKEKWADTDSIHARLTMNSAGNKGNISSAILDNKGHDDFKLGATDTFTLHDLKWIGDLGCIVLTAEGDDKWLFETITVTYGRNRSKTFTNTDKVWLSTDKSEGVNKLELCD